MKPTRDYGQRQSRRMIFAILLLAVLPASLGFSTFGSLPRTLPRVTVSMTSSIHTSASMGHYNTMEAYATTAVFMSTEKETEDPKHQEGSLRSRLRRATGFSLTAFRAAMRAATGISLTALYASALAATSAYVRAAMALILSPLPPWFRYFLQPFLILYYAPLFILRSLAGPTGKKARAQHMIFVDGFKAAVDAAEHKAGGYWPVHVNEDGDIVSVEPPQQSADGRTSKKVEKVDINQGIAESVEVVMDSKDCAPTG